jgi:hypothetical protein
VQAGVQSMQYRRTACSRSDAAWGWGFMRHARRQHRRRRRTTDDRALDAPGWSFWPLPPRAAARFASFSCTSFSTSDSSSDS